MNVLAAKLRDFAAKVGAWYSGEVYKAAVLASRNEWSAFHDRLFAVASEVIHDRLIGRRVLAAETRSGHELGEAFDELSDAVFSPTEVAPGIDERSFVRVVQALIDML